MCRKTNYCLYGRLIAGIIFFLNSFFVFSQKKDTTSLKLQEVEISTDAISTIKTTAVPTQQISQKDINREGIQSMADAVRRFAGVVVKDYGGIGGLKTVSIRGFGAQHTAVSLDGITVSDAQSGQIDISRYSLENVSLISLEIGQPDNIFQPARNFASVGVLSIVSSSPYFGNKTAVGNATIKGGSFGQFNPSFYIAKKLKNDYALSFNSEWQRADGNYPFDFKTGSAIEHRKRYNSDVSTWRFETNLYKKWGENGSLNCKTNYYDADRGLPGATISLDTYAKERLKTKTFFSQLNAIYKINNQLSWRAAGKFAVNKERYFNKPAALVGLDSTQIDNYRQYEYYATTTLLYQPSANLQISLAQDYIHNHLYTLYHDSGLDKEVYPQEVKAYRNTSITALNAKYTYKQFLLQAGLLGGYYGERVNKGAKPKDKKRISPTLSVNYEISSDWHIRTSYKDIYRVPTFNDMYYTQIGNRALKPEIARQIDLGAVFKHSDSQNQSYAFSADVYYNKVKNKIVATPTMFIWKMQNVDNVRIIGADVKGDYSVQLNKSAKLFVNGSYSYQDAENTNSKQQIIYTPKHSGNISISLENPWINVSYSLIACDSQWTAEYHSKLNKVDAYADQSLSFNKTVAIKKQFLRLQLDLLNLLDKNYEIIKNYPMPGRSFLASATWKF